MKIYFTYILFLAFSLRPAYNLGYVAYFELNIDYIIETYCVNKEKPKLKCNGKCHLVNQLSIKVDDLDDNTSYSATFFEAFFPVYFQQLHCYYKLMPNKTLTSDNWNYNTRFTSLFKECMDPPPRVWFT